MTVREFLLGRKATGPHPEPEANPENLFTYTWKIWPDPSPWFSSHYNVTRSDGIVGSGFAKDADDAMKLIQRWIANSEKGARMGTIDGATP